MQPDAKTTRLDPEPACAGATRRFVVTHLEQWGLGDLCDDAALCATELASNAILHSRTAFTVAVRPLAEGVRIDVQDDRPDRLPVPGPADGLGPIEYGTTGRGLKLVSAVAARWGFFNTPVAKTVWVELNDRTRPSPVAPVVELAAGNGSREAGVLIMSFQGLPVRSAVASGAQVDDLVRQVQLDPEQLSEEERSTFYRLLEQSATPRLTGRHEAFRAAGQGLDRFSFDVPVSPIQAAATVELSAFLHLMVQRGVLQAVEVGADVHRLRVWLADQFAAQSGGSAPTPYPA